MAVNMGVNYLAVIVATIAAFAIGFVWYGMVFAKQWSALHGMTTDQMRPQGIGLAVAIGAPLVNSWVLALLSLNLGGKTIGDALALGFLVWLGFFATQLAGVTVFQRKPWSLFGIDAGHALVVQLVIAAIVTLWR